MRRLDRYGGVGRRVLRLAYSWAVFVVGRKICRSDVGRRCFREDEGRDFGWGQVEGSYGYLVRSYLSYAMNTSIYFMLALQVQDQYGYGNSPSFLIQIRQLRPLLLAFRS